jgi:hypothetical protein
MKCGASCRRPGSAAMEEAISQLEDAESNIDSATE